jgi:hypothetical protein
MQSPPISWQEMTDAQKLNYLLGACRNIHEWIDEVTPQIQAQIQTMSTQIHRLEDSTNRHTPFTLRAEKNDDNGNGALLNKKSPAWPGFLDMEARWLRLAQSIEFTQRLDHFANPTPKIKRPRS